LTSEPLLGFQFEPHHCFACGELNEGGLRLALHADGAGCWTEVTLEPKFQGWESVAHGGIVATLLDEVMAWSVIGRDTWGVTARLSVAFRHPIPIGRPIRAEGWVTEDRRRTFRTAGRVIDTTSARTLATGEGVFMVAPPAQLAELKARYRLRPAEPAAPAAPDARPAAGDSGPAAGDTATPAAETPDLVAPR
jgi:acyl-coenzyme A thioesterase PaaI-like protein